MDSPTSQAKLTNSTSAEKASIGPAAKSSSEVLTKHVPIQDTVIESSPDDPHDEQPTLKERITLYQQELEDEFKRFEQSLSTRDKDHELESMDWKDLEDHYDQEMSLQNAAEQAIMNDFATRFKQFTLWMQVSNEKETERALKRFRTRSTFVQNSEDELDDKQDQYAKVLAAFHDAMALLGNL